MSSSAQSPQGDQTAQAPKKALFSALRSNFAVGGALPPRQTPIASPKPATVTPAPADPVPVPLPPEPKVEPEETEEPKQTEQPQPPEEPKEEKEEISSLAAAVPTAVAQVAAQAAEDSLNPSHAVGGSVKEAGPIPTTSEAPQVDVTPGVQYVETERAEISPEVEAFLEQVENHHEQLPQEVVIAKESGGDAVVQPLPQPVIVLPLTQEVEKKGAHKNPGFSVRWLVEWSHKMIKMFAGRVVYRTAE